MSTAKFSFVLETLPAMPEAARQHFAAKLEFETDAWDVKTDLERGRSDFIVVDTRSHEDFENRHISGAVNLPHRTINAETTAALSKEKLIVTYCWGPGCNGSTKGALRFAELGFRVKEMIGGLEYWIREGGQMEGKLEADPSESTIPAGYAG